ncbi:MAG TPA: hypothetical protein VNV86_17290 [Candidatus Acidoferrum sp.]|nr:hypothetical protein [Candidatus Acidoferrum sp.]
MMQSGVVAAADYKAGAGSAGSAMALAIEDSHGMRAVFAQAEFRITQQVADYVAVQAMKDHELDRAGLLLRWSGIGNRPAQPDDLVAAIDAAFTKLEPAVVRYVRRGLSVVSEEFERCLGALSPDASLSFGGCWKEGTAITGGMRAAFQMVEPAHGLLQRGDTVQSYPVQAIGLGKVVTILALSGEAAMPEGVNPRGLIFAPFSNEASPPPARDPRVSAAVQRVLARAR